MASIEEFCQTHGASARSIEDVLNAWRSDRLSRELVDAVVVGGVLAADLVVGDGFRDQIPRQMRDAVASLARKPADRGTYDEVRREVREMVARGDSSVEAWIRNYKGQIGEGIFLSEAGGGARLAASASQKGYDVVRGTSSETEFIQVKIYSDSDAVVMKMHEVERQLAAGEILAEGSDIPVEAINWAISDNLVEEVRERIANIPELAHIVVYPAGITADDAAAVLRSGIDAVGAEGVAQLGGLLGELTSGVATAATLQAAVAGFLWWKGEREAAEAREQVIDSLATSSIALSTALVLENLADQVTYGGPVGFLVGFTARQVVGRALASRRGFVRHNEAENQRIAGMVQRLVEI